MYWGKLSVEWSRRISSIIQSHLLGRQNNHYVSFFWARDVNVAYCANMTRENESKSKKRIKTSKFILKKIKKSKKGKKSKKVKKVKKKKVKK